MIEMELRYNGVLMSRVTVVKQNDYDFHFSVIDSRDGLYVIDQITKNYFGCTTEAEAIKLYGNEH